MAINLPSMSTFSQSIDSPRLDAALNSLGVNGFQFPGGTDKNSDHSYGPVYEAILIPLAEKESCSILEVGVQHGGSILLWNYLCPNALIIGVDIQDIVHSSIYERANKHVRFVMGDAYGEAVVNLVGALSEDGFDVIIDDGPHTLASQCAFLACYLEKLKPTGVAIIEDIQAPEWFDTLEAHVPVGFIAERVDRRHIKNRYDDLMLIIKRAPNG
jgi:hypothetical protein